MRTKNVLLSIPFVILALLLTACNGISSQAGTTSTTTGTAGAQAGTSLSTVNMLLVGTLKLEDTNQAVTADEAVKLLPLWQAYRSLSTSQTASEVEVEALLNQIQSTMTSEQVDAIKAMNLTSTDMMALMQSMGGGMGANGTPNPQGTPSFDISGGGFPAGDFPSGSTGGSAGSPPSGSSGGPSGGGQGGSIPRGSGVVIVGGGGDAGSAAGLNGGPMLQGTQDPSMQATAQARFSTQANQVNTVLLDVLITKLDARTTQ